MVACLIVTAGWFSNYGASVGHICDDWQIYAIFDSESFSVAKDIHRLA